MRLADRTGSITAEDLLITEELAHRPPRAANHAAENDALYELGRLFIETPEAVPNHLVELAVRLCGAGSAGISLLERSEAGAEIFRWKALAGEFAPHEGGFSPRDFSPCGICLDRGEPVLLSDPWRLFTYLDGALPAVIEALVIPLCGVGRRPIGTMWIVSHDSQRRFDHEDRRLMSRLADFCALAIENVTARKMLEQSEARLQELRTDLLHVSRLSAMGQIAAMMAHELNQPLASITNYMNAGRRLLAGRDPGNPERLKEALERAAEQAMWAGQIIDGLRSFVKRPETEKQPEPVAEIVEEACRLASIGARRRGVLLQLQLDPSADLVLVDRIQVQQVMLNLLHNAIQAMERPDRREITICTQRKGQTIEVSVADTGPGLASEISAQLFQPFVTTKRDGMGMGLSICHSIISSHGGDLWSEENPGGGTIFRFTLRAVPKTVPA
jgi:signal transduction histidine kinase